MVEVGHVVRGHDAVSSNDHELVRGWHVVMTGGGGFIGSHLLARMIGAGMHVTLLGPDVGPSRYTASLVAKGVVRFFRCDAAFAEKDGLPRIVESADVVVLLGYTMPRSSSPAGRLVDELNRNVAPTVRLLQAALRGTPHVMFASSVSVYGAPTSSPARETDAPGPLTPYAIATLSCERAIAELCTAAGVSASILRYSSVYGPGEAAQRTIPNFIRAVLSGTQPPVDGDGLDEHDYIHVADAVDATMSALRRRADVIYNVATGIGTTTIELANLIVGLAGGLAAPVRRVGPETETSRARLILDTNRMSSELECAPRHALPDGLRDEIGWFRAQFGGNLKTAA